MAFYLPNYDLDGADRVLKKIGLDSNTNFCGSTLYDWRFPFSNDPVVARSLYLQNIIQVARWLWKKQGMKTIFLRQSNNIPGVKGDRAIMEEVQDSLGDAGICLLDYYLPELQRGLINKCSVFYGTRMHSNIFAITQNTPVVAIKYQHETQGVMEMCGLGDYFVDIADFTAGELYEKILIALNNREAISELLKKINREFMKTRKAIKEDIRACLGTIK